MTLHDGQLHIDEATVRRLVAAQFPEWGREPIAVVAGSGTVNAVFRIGDDLAARFPLTGTEARTRAALRAEASALNEFAEHSPFAVPLPVALGEPGEGYPLPWSVQTWIEGDIATPGSLADSEAFADDLATLIAALRSADTRGRRFSGTGRGGAFDAHDAWMAECIERNTPWFDSECTGALWRAFRRRPRGEADGMTHGDLIPANLLVRDGRLVGVLDGGGFGPSDPALDLVCGWHLLDAVTRPRLRRALAVTDAEWLRGAAWAFQQAMGLVWYYRDTNPVMRDLGHSTLRRLLADPEVCAAAGLEPAPDAAG